MALSRRALLGGALGSVVAGGGAEWISLRGNFDHRTSPGASAKERFAASVRAAEATDGVVHVGHSTHLVALAGMRFLTDPWFNDPAFGALSHEVVPAVLPEDVGPLGAILVTHDHADHADMRAIDRMDKRAVAIVATKELASRMRQSGFGDVTVLAPWEERKLGEVTVTAVPGLHDIYEIGFVLRARGKCVYFAGDTALHPEMRAIAERFTPDVALLPVDGTRLTGGGLHVMRPEDAVEAARILRARAVVPSHAEAYFSDPLVAHAIASMVPRARFRFGELMQSALPSVRCVVPAAGELVTLA